MSKDDLIKEYQRKLQKALGHFKYSYTKILNLPMDARKLDEEMMETWEGFSARFCRLAELYMAKYLRARIFQNDPAFDGSFRDMLDLAEKLRQIDSADVWFKIRELRNMAAHDYTEEELTEYFKKLLQYSPFLLDIEKKIS